MDAETRRRLEQLVRAIALDGHGVLVRTGGEVVVQIGEDGVCRSLSRLAVLATDPMRPVTEWLSGGLVACGQQRCGLALVVAVPENVSSMQVHGRVANVLGMLAALVPPPSPNGSAPPGREGESGAPAELSIAVPTRRKPN